MSPLHPIVGKVTKETSVTIGALMLSAVGAFCGLIVGFIVGIPISFIWGIFFAQEATGAQDDDLWQPAFVCAIIGAVLGFLIAGGALAMFKILSFTYSLFVGMNLTHADRQRLQKSVRTSRSSAATRIRTDRADHQARLSENENLRREATRKIRDQ